MVYNSMKEELSPRCFPIRAEINKYISYINGFKDRDTRVLLKVIACSGVRFSEALNSFILFDNVNNTYFLDCYALKRSRETKFTLGHTKAVKIETLQRDYAYAPYKFKSVPMLNLYGINFDELREMANDIDTPRLQMRPFSSYLSKKYHKAFYRILKKDKSILFRVYYLNSKLSGIEKEIDIVPSFHFYRKLFASELLFRTKDAALTAETMKWTNINRILDYVKKYNTLDSKLNELTKW